MASPTVLDIVTKDYEERQRRKMMTTQSDNQFCQDQDPT